MIKLAYTRRDLLKSLGGGIASNGFADILSRQGLLAASPTHGQHVTGPHFERGTRIGSQ